MRNTKYEILNTKQIQITKIQNSKRYNIDFEHLNPAHRKIGWMNLEFKDYLGFNPKHDSGLILVLHRAIARCINVW